MNALQAYRKLIEHLEEECNRNVVDITIEYGIPREGKDEIMFFVSYDDEFADNGDDLVKMYVDDKGVR
jgi:hypothetical protein